MSKIEKTVFISYRRVDMPLALLVYDNLKGKKYDVFFDFNSIPSGDFEQSIISNIKARAHFILILTPTALDRCMEPEDWLRREIETAIEVKRNIIPLFFNGFSFSTPSIETKLTGDLSALPRYNGLEVPLIYFKAAMSRLRRLYLNIPLDAVLHPASPKAKKVVKRIQAAADKNARLIKNELLHAMKNAPSEQAPEDREASLINAVINKSLEIDHQIQRELQRQSEEAFSGMIIQGLDTTQNVLSKDVDSQLSERLVLFPIEELAFRKKPIISPDTLIRRISLTEQLVSKEPVTITIAKIGVQGQWVKVCDASDREGYVAAWLVKPADNLTTSEMLDSVDNRAVVERFKQTLSSLAEEASSEIVQQELEAMRYATSESAISDKPALTSILSRIAIEYGGEIGRDTPKEKLNEILTKYPKTNEIKG